MILNASQAGDGPPVILLHGLFGAARNFGAIQRSLAPRFRVIALDMRNHGDSPHDPDMRYIVQAADVRETLLALGIEQAAVIGHSMGGKAAMALALESPDRVGRLLVSDIAPVTYQHGNGALAEAMRAIPLTSGLTRRAADAAFADAVPDQTLRPFLLQNLRVGTQPRWRIGLEEIHAAIPDLEGWDDVPRCSFRSAIVRDRRPIGLRAARTPANYPKPVPDSPLRRGQNAGHWVHADNPAGFLAVVEAFLQGWP